MQNDEKKRRARRLLEVSKELEIEYYKKYIGKTVEVLIEDQKDGFSYGHTGNYLHVKTKSNLEHNTFHNLKITDIDYPYCIGE